MSYLVTFNGLQVRCDNIKDLADLVAHIQGDRLTIEGQTKHVARALDVACPECGAHKQNPCMGHNASTGFVHIARVEHARKEAST